MTYSKKQMEDIVRNVKEDVKVTLNGHIYTIDIELFKHRLKMLGWNI